MTMNKPSRFSISVLLLLLSVALLVLSSCGTPDYLTFYDISGSDAYFVMSEGDVTDKTVSIPAKHDGKPVTQVGMYAFSECRTVKKVKLPKSVTYIGSYAFCDCTALTSFSMEKVTAIGQCAFQNCTALTSLDLAGLASIGPSAFEGCTSLTSITIPASVMRISSNAFRDCTSLTEVIFENPEGWSINSVMLSDPARAAKTLKAGTELVRTGELLPAVSLPPVPCLIPDPCRLLPCAISSTQAA